MVEMPKQQCYTRLEAMVEDIAQAHSNDKDSSPPSSKPPRELPDIQKVPATYYMAHNGYTNLLKLLSTTKYFDKYPPHAMNTTRHTLPGTTPLWAALVKGHIDAAELILALPSTDIKTMYNPKLAPSPLTIAAQNGQAESVKFILGYLKQHIGEVETSRFLELRMPSTDGARALFKAAQNNHLEVCKLLVNAGADINASTLKDFATPLSIACVCGHDKMVCYFLSLSDKLVYVDPATPPSLPPLHGAAQSGELAVIGQIIRYCDSMHEWSAVDELNEKVNGGLTPIHFACIAKKNCEGVLRALLTGVGGNGKLSKVKLTQPCTEKRLTPQMLCSQRGRVDTLKTLIEFVIEARHDLELDERDKDGRTALFYACEAKSLSSVQILLKHGADPKLPREVDGMTCLHVAASGNQVEIVKELLAGGADVHQRKKPEKDGKGSGTARSIANKLDNDCAPILMEASKRTKPREKSEETMPDWAKGHGLEKYLTLAPGKAAVVTGLKSRADLNGNICKLVRFDEREGRWIVLITSEGKETKIKIKPENLSLSADTPPPRPK